MPIGNLLAAIEEKAGIHTREAIGSLDSSVDDHEKRLKDTQAKVEAILAALAANSIEVGG